MDAANRYSRCEVLYAPGQRGVIWLMRTYESFFSPLTRDVP
jgi:hypothetical protein